MKKRSLFTCACLLSLTACKNNATDQTTLDANKSTSMPETVYEPVKRYADLLWVEDANPVADARKALGAGQAKLWVYHTRGGPQIPGVESHKVAETLQKHPTQAAPAMGDTVYSERHLKLKLKFTEYAKSYNQTILSQ